MGENYWFDEGKSYEHDPTAFKKKDMVEIFGIFDSIMFLLCCVFHGVHLSAKCRSEYIHQCWEAIHSFKFFGQEYAREEFVIQFRLLGYLCCDTGHSTYWDLGDRT